MSADNSADNLPKPDLAKPVGHVLGDGLLKLIGGIAAAGVLAFAGWMSSMYDTQKDLRASADQVNFKIDLLSQQLAEAKDAGKEAEAIARENARRLERIEATRYTEADAEKAMAPIEHRLGRLESGRRR